VSDQSSSQQTGVVLRLVTLAIVGGLRANRKSYKRGCQVKNTSPEKHFSLPERQKYFSGIQPPAILPTFLL
jgi:hypothetical protein